MRLPTLCSEREDLTRHHGRETTTTSVPWQELLIVHCASSYTLHHFLSIKAVHKHLTLLASLLCLLACSPVTLSRHPMDNPFEKILSGLHSLGDFLKGGSYGHISGIQSWRISEGGLRGEFLKGGFTVLESF